MKAIVYLPFGITLNYWLGLLFWAKQRQMIIELIYRTKWTLKTMLIVSNREKSTSYYNYRLTSESLSMRLHVLINSAYRHKVYYNWRPNCIPNTALETTFSTHAKHILAASQFFRLLLFPSLIVWWCMLSLFLCELSCVLLCMVSTNTFRTRGPFPVSP